MGPTFRSTGRGPVNLVLHERGDAQLHRAFADGEVHHLLVVVAADMTSVVVAEGEQLCGRKLMSGALEAVPSAILRLEAEEVVVRPEAKQEKPRNSPRLTHPLRRGDERQEHKETNGLHGQHLVGRCG